MANIGSTKPRRRWLQFSLRTLLIGMTLVGVLMGWFTLKLKKAMRQHEAVENIYAEHGHVFYIADDRGDEDFLPRLAREELTPSTLDQWLTPEFFRPPLVVQFSGWGPLNVPYQRLAELDELRGCDLVHANVHDEDLKTIRGLRPLKVLNLTAARISNDGLRHLADMQQLETLDLDDTRVSDAGLSHLAQLSQLKSLRLMRTNVTDAGVPALQQFKHLEQLMLDGIDLSDAGLDQLSQMSSLTYLSITNTKVTGEGVARFRAARPECQIDWK